MSTLYDSVQQNNDATLDTKTVIHNTVNNNKINNDLTLTKDDVIFILNKLRNCKIYGKQTEYFYKLVLKLQKLYDDLSTGKSS